MTTLATNEGERDEKSKDFPKECPQKTWMEEGRRVTKAIRPTLCRHRRRRCCRGNWECRNLSGGRAPDTGYICGAGYSKYHLTRRLPMEFSKGIGW